MPRATTRRQDAPLVQLSGDRADTGDPFGRKSSTMTRRLATLLRSQHFVSEIKPRIGHASDMQDRRD
jgi:hypothetical protein